MRNRFRSLGVCLLLSSLFSLAGLATAADYTPGKLHNYSHEDGTVEKNNYQYSIFVPKEIKISTGIVTQNRKEASSILGDVFFSNTSQGHGVFLKL